MEKLKNINLVFEAPVGAGKSSLCSSLESYLNNKLNETCKFYPEFLNDKVLDLYLKDMKNNAYSYQIIAIRERHRILERSQNVSIGIIDRGLHGDLMFAYTQYESGFINEDQLEAYLELAKLDFNITKPYYVVYLDTNPEVCYNRHLKRNRKIDNGYPFDLFKIWKKNYDLIINYVENKQNSYKLPQKFRSLLDEFPKCKIIRIHYNADISAYIQNNIINDEKLEQILNQIYEQL